MGLAKSCTLSISTTQGPIQNISNTWQAVNGMIQKMISQDGFRPCRVPPRWIQNDTQTSAIEATRQLGLAQVEASIQRPGGTAGPPRFEHFVDSFRGLFGGCGGNRMAWRAHADDDEFDEACELAADLWLKEVSRSEATRKGTCIGGTSIGKRPNVERDFLNAHVRIIANYFGSNSGLECSAFPGLSPSIPAQPRYSDELFQRRFRTPRNLFVRIFNGVKADEVYFTWRKDAVGNPGASGLQKAVSAQRQLAYGTAANSTDEYCKISETTASGSLSRFSLCVVRCLALSFYEIPQNTT
jgi:hypothetical protein